MTKPAVWTTEAAIEMCRAVEAICPVFGCHVALTGGTLYKNGMRKDADILFYNIRQIDEMDLDGLLEALTTIGFYIGKQFGWVRKAQYQGKDVDMFFPELFPSSSQQASTGGY